MVPDLYYTFIYANPSQQQRLFNLPRLSKYSKGMIALPAVGMIKTGIVKTHSYSWSSLTMRCPKTYSSTGGKYEVMVMTMLLVMIWRAFFFLGWRCPPLRQDFFRVQRMEASQITIMGSAMTYTNVAHALWFRS